jgi:hypothetical protein
MTRADLKWHSSFINIAADPATKTIYHKMGPLLVALKPLVHDGNEYLTVAVNDGPVKRWKSKAFRVQDLLKQCGVE